MRETPRWARVTPYEAGVPGREFAERTFRDIRAEAETRGLDLTDPGAFILLGEVGRAIREIQGEEHGGDTLHRFGAFLFQAFHFHAAGETLFLLEQAAARLLVESSFQASPWRGEMPREAGYLQLPEHLFWSEPQADNPAELVDGVFWARSSDHTLSLLAVLGLHGGRPGMSLAELPPVKLEDADTLLEGPVRDGGADFSNTLPGGDLGRLYTLSALGETLKLVARAFAHLASVPEALGPGEDAPDARTLEGHESPARISRLAFRRIGLGPEQRVVQSRGLSEP